jgi:5-methylcytosine-specific restriction endonuclease McrA
VLREEKAAGWSTQGFWLFKRHVFVAGKRRAAKAVTPATLTAMGEQQASQALPVLVDGVRSYWWCLDRFYWEDEGLAAEDVYALAYERQLRARRKLERARTTVAVAGLPQSRRQPIPRELRQTVFARDGGRCVECDATFDLQFDHVIPVAMGGATSEQNLQLLCGGCNREKGASLG